jgi:hypothetical protein
MQLEELDPVAERVGAVEAVLARHVIAPGHGVAVLGQQLGQFGKAEEVAPERPALRAARC